MKVDSIPANKLSSLTSSNKSTASSKNKVPSIKKKILVLSYWDIHGASEVAYRWCKYFVADGHDVAMMVREKTKNDSFIIEVQPLLPHVNMLKRGYNQAKKVINPKSQKFIQTDPKYAFYNTDESTEFVSAQAILQKLPFVPDIVIVGWVSGFVNTTVMAELHEKTKAHIYLVTTDMSPLTGGCHYAWDCKGYESDCSNCPAIPDEANKQLASKNLALKLENIRRAGMEIVAGSGWTYTQAKRSTLFREQKEIPNVNGCIDTNFFTNRHRSYAKQIFDIPAGSKIIFTGSELTDNERKGISYFVEALDYLWNNLDAEARSRIYVLVAGNNVTGNPIVAKIPFKTHTIDYIKDYRLLALAYQAADVFVCASLEDSGPLMVPEAMACGTPVVAFEMGYANDMVISGVNGYRAKLRDSKDMGKGIKEILTLTEEQHNQYGQNAIEYINEFSSKEFFLNTMNKSFTKLA